MPISADGYLNHLSSYLDTRELSSNKAHYGQLCKAKERKGQGENEITLADDAEGVDERLKVRMQFSGRVLGIRLDACQSPLFHFLDPEGQRPWRKRCDFVLFHSHKNRLRCYCIEFKKARTRIPSSDVMLQLHAGEAWCATLHRLLLAYSNKTTPIHVSKYVFTACENPGPDLDSSGKYLKDHPDIRHYLFSEAEGMALEDLENDSQTDIV